MRPSGLLIAVLMTTVSLGPDAAGKSALPSGLPFLNWEKLPSLPDPEGFASPFAGTVGDTLIVAGGANFPGKRPWEGGTKVWYDQAYALSRPDGAWKIIGRLTRPLAYGVSVSTRDAMICLGGGDNSAHYADVFMLRWDGTHLSSRPLPSLPQPCAFMAGALAGSVIYIAGGIERPDATSALSTFWSLDLTAAHLAWRTLPRCPGPARILAVAAAVQQRFYLFSGCSLHPDSNSKPARTYLRDAYAYDPTTGWSQLPDLPHAAAAAASPAPITADGQILILTGDDGRATHLNGPNHPGFPQDVLGYQPATKRWRKIGTTPFSRATVPTAEWRGRWIIANGERIPAFRSPDIWSLDFTPPREH